MRTLSARSTRSWRGPIHGGHRKTGTGSTIAASGWIIFSSPRRSAKASAPSSITLIRWRRITARSPSLSRLPPSNAASRTKTSPSCGARSTGRRWRRSCSNYSSGLRWLPIRGIGQRYGSFKASCSSPSRRKFSPSARWSTPNPRSASTASGGKPTRRKCGRQCR